MFNHQRQKYFCDSSYIQIEGNMYALLYFIEIGLDTEHVMRIGLPLSSEVLILALHWNIS